MHPGVPSPVQVQAPARLRIGPGFTPRSRRKAGFNVPIEHGGVSALNPHFMGIGSTIPLSWHNPRRYR
jgi:hypothetical protein